MQCEIRVTVKGEKGLVLTADQRSVILAYMEADEQAAAAHDAADLRQLNAIARAIRDKNPGTVGTWIALGLWRGDWRAVLGVR